MKMRKFYNQVVFLDGAFMNEKDKAFTFIKLLAKYNIDGIEPTFNNTHDEVIWERLLEFENKYRKPKAEAPVFKSLEEATDWAMQAAKSQRENPTKAEVAFFDILKRCGFVFAHQAPHIYRKTNGVIVVNIVDFKLGGEYKNHIFEIDGLYHETPEQRQRDFERDVHFEALGFKVHRLTNEEVIAMSKLNVYELSKCLSKIIDGGDAHIIAKEALIAREKEDNDMPL